MLEEGWQITGHFDGFCHVFLMSGQYFVTFKTMFRSQWLEADHCVNCIHLHVATTLEFCSYSYQMACIHTCIMWFRHYSHCMKTNVLRCKKYNNLYWKSYSSPRTAFCEILAEIYYHEYHWKKNKLCLDTNRIFSLNFFFALSLL